MVREAAVLVPVYRRSDGELIVVLVARVQGGVHGGQLALPGERDPADADLAASALREANEEKLRLVSQARPGAARRYRRAGAAPPRQLAGAQ
jgi:hypothetical protein